MKLSEAIDVFIEHVCAGKQNETPLAYRTKLHQLVVRMGDRSIETITANDLDDFRVSLLNQKQITRGHQVVEKSLTADYVRGVLKTAKHLFRWLSATGRLGLDSAANLAVPKRSKPNPKYVEDEVISKMSAAAAVVGDAWEQTRNTALLSVLRNTGARIGGVLAATMQGTDIEGGVITTIEKGGNEKKLYFNAAARADLKRWLAVRSQLEPKDDHLFLGQGGQGLSRSGAEKIWNRLAVAASIEGQRHNFHSFRHAFAHDSIRAGADLSHVSQLMGHSSTAITSDYYLQYTHDELQSVHARVSPSVLSATADSVVAPDLKNQTETAVGENLLPRGLTVLQSGDMAAMESLSGTSPMIILAVGSLNTGLMKKLIEFVNQINV